jgi:hypothetical protein
MINQIDASVFGFEEKIQQIKTTEEAGKADKIPPFSILSKYLIKNHLYFDISDRPADPP